MAPSQGAAPGSPVVYSPGLHESRVKIIRAIWKSTIWDILEKILLADQDWKSTLGFPSYKT